MPVQSNLPHVCSLRTYVDNIIFVSADDNKISKCIEQLQEAQCRKEDQGTVTDYLRVSSGPTYKAIRTKSLLKTTKIIDARKIT